jgi:stringent starvation protein B
MQMLETSDNTSTRPYLIRALYEWCTDNGLTPYVAVAVDNTVQVPQEFVKDGEIVLNVSFDATTALTLGNEFIEFKARFGGVAREIIVPVDRVTGIYARENGQGMAFPISTTKTAKSNSPSAQVTLMSTSGDSTPVTELKHTQLVSVELSRSFEESVDGTEPPRPTSSGQRPTLTRVK